MNVKERARWSLILLSAIALLGACGSSRAVQGPPGAPHRLTLDSFVASPGAVETSSDFAVEDVESTTPPTDSSSEGEESTAGTEYDSVEIVTDAPPADPLPPIAPGREIVLDSLVGQINGRPVFADAFFQPIDAKLRLAAEQSSRLQFLVILEQEIALHLRDILESELILAQAQLQLTEQQQQGLFAFLAQQEEQFVLETGGGSSEEARRRLFEERGISMEDLMEEERQRALIQLILQQEISPRIDISWRDIERDYQEQFEKYNPPGQARIAKIWIDSTQHADLVQQITDRLARNEPFMTVWETMDAVYRDDNTYTVPTGGLGEITDLIQLYREQLAPLQPGETSPPFEHELTSGSQRQVWLHVVEITQAPGRSIYDENVQLELRTQIYQRRFAEERMRYMEEQLGEEVIKDIADMAVRLAVVGEARYLE